MESGAGPEVYTSPSLWSACSEVRGEISIPICQSHLPSRVPQLTEAGGAVHYPQAEAGVGEAAREDGVEAELLVRLVSTSRLP